MWTPEKRERHDRSRLRYPSDLSDEEWRIVEPFIPPARRGGRHRSVDLRAVLNGVLYVLETGCQWRHLPKDLPPNPSCRGKAITCGNCRPRRAAAPCSVTPPGPRPRWRWLVQTDSLVSPWEPPARHQQEMASVSISKPPLDASKNHSAVSVGVIPLCSPTRRVLNRPEGDKREPSST